MIEANNTLGRSPHKTFSGSVREVGDHIEHTYQALAINERRPVFVRTGAVLTLILHVDGTMVAVYPGDPISVQS